LGIIKHSILSYHFFENNLGSLYVGLMFWYSWKMALLALVIVPPFFLLAIIATPFGSSLLGMVR
jgi:ABC-type bacteriocin/lantibiotic exporter with double-glycine peptidase domain